MNKQSTEAPGKALAGLQSLLPGRRRSPRSIATRWESTMPVRAHGSLMLSAGISPRTEVRQVGAASASEDFGSFGTGWGVPSMFWFVGGTDPGVYAKAKAAREIDNIPSNHSPYFAPVMHPTLETGVETMVVATLAWLAP